jgi:hypothetical protein
VSQVKQLFIVFWMISSTILLQVVPCSTIWWKETRPHSISNIDKVEFSYDSGTVRYGNNY